MYSLVILNWKRPQNVVEIVNKMKQYSCIDEIIISNGNKEHAVKMKHRKIKVYDDSILNGKYGLDLRFIRGLSARNYDIIMIDDDLYVEEPELRKLIAEYERNKNRIVGKWGRPLDNKPYKVANIYGNVDIVLTRLLIFQKQLCYLFFKCKPLIEHIYKKGIPYGNGEDIFLSIITGIYFKNKHYAMKSIKVTELPERKVGIHSNKYHKSYRTTLCSYLYRNIPLFQKYISGLTPKKHLPLTSKEHLQLKLQERWRIQF